MENQETSAAKSPADDQSAANAKRHRRRIRAIRSFFLRLLSLTLVLYILLFHIVGIMTMPNGDMYPRMDAGDLILFYRIDRNPKTQDIIVIDKAVNTDYSAVTVPENRPEPGTIRKVLNFLGFKDPEAPETHSFVCRVIGGPGDTIEVSDERGLAVNGNAMIESNIFYQTRPYEGFTEYPIQLGPDEYFVMADFRNGGADSRFFGPVKQDEIKGIVITILRRNNM